MSSVECPSVVDVSEYKKMQRERPRETTEGARSLAFDGREIKVTVVRIVGNNN